MNNFKRGGYKSEGSSFGGKKSYGGDKKYGNGPRRDQGSNRPTELFATTCSECSKKCEVPFKPSNDKPVFCSACFGIKKSANETRDSGNRNDRSDRSNTKNARPDYTQLPRDQRPPRHDASRGNSDNGILELKRQITALDFKLNKILDLINPPQPSAKVPLPEPVKTEKVEKIPTTKTAKKIARKKAAGKVVTKKAPAKKVAKKAVKKVAKKVTKK